MIKLTRKSDGFPRAPLVAAFALVGLSLTVAVVGSLTNAAATAPNGTIAVQRDLVFEDRSDGAVIVRAAGNLQPLQVFEGENGFLRGTLRGFARGRRAEHQGSTAPFRLTRSTDGRLTLDDLATGRHVELMAFGADNAVVFARLLPATALTAGAL